MFSKYAPDGMNGIMPVQPFLYQPAQSPDDGFHAHRDLVLDDNVDRRMQPLVRQLCLFITMVFLDEMQTFTFIQRQPLGRLRGLQGIVSFLCIHTGMRELIIIGIMVCLQLFTDILFLSN